jgi:hypothetical protein
MANPMKEQEAKLFTALLVLGFAMRVQVSSQSMALPPYALLSHWHLNFKTTETEVILFSLTCLLS